MIPKELDDDIKRKREELVKECEKLLQGHHVCCTCGAEGAKLQGPSDEIHTSSSPLPVCCTCGAEFDVHYLGKYYCFKHYVPNY